MTLPVESHHLEGLLPPIEDENDPNPSLSYEPPRIQTLVLDSSRITDDAAGAISACHDLRSLHLAETRISSEQLWSPIGRVRTKLTASPLAALVRDSPPPLDRAHFLSPSRAAQLDVVPRRAGHAAPDFLRSVGEGRGQSGLRPKAKFEIPAGHPRSCCE